MRRSRFGLGLGAVALGKTIVVLTLVTGIGFSLRDAIQLEKETTTVVRQHAWSWSEQERLRAELAGWYPIVEGVRRSLPRRAVIWCWTSYPAPLEVVFDLIALLRSVLAPRLLLAASTSEFVATWNTWLAPSGLPVYFLEIHPSFAPEAAESTPAHTVVDTMRAWPVVERRSDFTLRHRGSGR